MRGRVAAAGGWAAAALGVALAAVPAEGSAWDFGGGVGLQQMWDENVMVTSTGQTGDAISSLRLTGMARYSGRRTSFDGQYDPVALFYRDRTYLNVLSHFASARLRWDASARSVLSLSDRFTFTPEQGVSSTSPSVPAFLTRVSDRRTNDAFLDYMYRLSGRSSFGVSVRHYLRSFSNPHLGDNTAVVPGIRYEYQFPTGTAVDASASHGWHRFGVQLRSLLLDCSAVRPEEPCLPDPIRGSVTAPTQAATQSVSAGLRQRLGSRAFGTLRLGWTAVDREDPRLRDVRAQLIQCALQWRGARTDLWFGYNRDVNTESGIASVIHTDVLYLSAVMRFGQDLTGRILANQTYSRGFGSFKYRGVDSFNGQAMLDYRFNRTWSVNGSYSRQIQDATRSGVPNLTFDRYAVGFAAAFD